MAIEKRELGKSGIKVSPLCLGGNVFGWTIDEPTSFKILDAFVASGLEFIDTADVYSKWKPGNQGGESETIIGDWFKKSGKREQVILATKVGMELAPDKKGLAKAYILKACEDSLKRLKTDHIDLYQSHTDDQSVPLDETLSAYEQLIKQGKVRAIGASNYTAERLNEALKVSHDKKLPAYQTLQPLYNLFDRETFEKGLQGVCREHHVGVISYFSLASGFLTGKYRSEKDFSKSSRGADMQKYMNERGFKILKALDQVSENLSATQGQVALAWIMAKPTITAPIASATNLDQLQDLVKATQLKLDTRSMNVLDEASSYAKGPA